MRSWPCMSWPSHPIRDAWIEIYRIAPQRHYPRRIPYGMCGLKLQSFDQSVNQVRSHPIRDAWIEILDSPFDSCVGESHPIRDAWIEIPATWIRHGHQAGRIPYGMRGLKCRKSSGREAVHGSHPIRDAWIEISGTSGANVAGSSHPIRDAWIEIR